MSIDRLVIVLDRCPVQVCNLKPQRVRLDSTTAIGYWGMNEEDLFQLGHSKDYREWWDVWNRYPLNRNKQKRMAFLLGNKQP